MVDWRRRCEEEVCRDGLRRRFKEVLRLNRKMLISIRQYPDQSFLTDTCTEWLLGCISGVSAGAHNLLSATYGDEAGSRQRAALSDGFPLEVHMFQP